MATSYAIIQNLNQNLGNQGNFHVSSNPQTIFYISVYAPSGIINYQVQTNSSGYAVSPSLLPPQSPPTLAKVDCNLNGGVVLVQRTSTGGLLMLPVGLEAQSLGKSFSMPLPGGLSAYILIGNPGAAPVTANIRVGSGPATQVGVNARSVTNFPLVGYAANVTITTTSPVLVVAGLGNGDVSGLLPPLPL